MGNKVALRELATRGLRAASIAAFLALLASLSLSVGAAAAKRHALVGRDGKIHACYRVKGRPKGMVRVVRSRSHRCRRGERRLSWSVAGGAGQSGQAGANGGGGQTAVSTSKEAALETKVAGLTLQVEQLEGLVKELSGEMSGVLGRVDDLEGVLEGVDNEGLKEAVAAVPLLGEVCEQTEALTGVTNEFGTEFQQLLTTLTGSLLGGIFGGISVPEPVAETLSCPGA
jgi:hypothetical protein